MPHVSHFFFLPCVFFLVSPFIFLSCFAFPFAITHNSIVDGLYNHSMYNFVAFSHSNYPKIEEKLTISTYIVRFPCCLTLGKPNTTQACLDTLCWMLIGHHIFQSFPQPTFWQCHWSPCHITWFCQNHS